MCGMSCKLSAARITESILRKKYSRCLAFPLCFLLPLAVPAQDTQSDSVDAIRHEPAPAETAGAARRMWPVDIAGWRPGGEFSAWYFLS